MSQIYHITKKETWAKAKEQNLYDFCTLKDDGFIHCSTGKQYLLTANRLFIHETDQLILLSIDEHLVQQKVTYENLEGGTELFPHIYGALNLDAVTGVYNLIKNKRGEFAPLF